MKFGRIDTGEAEGAFLAHSIKAGETRLSKGHLLTRPDIALLKACGHATLVVARLEEEDLAENDAAKLIGDALAGSGLNLRAAAPATGRVNIHSTAAGLFRASRLLVDRINRIDPAITLACLPDQAAVRAGEMIATVKIIPYAANRLDVEKACFLANGRAALQVKPFRRHRAALIATAAPSLKEQTMDKTRAALGERLSALGSALCREWRVKHEETAAAAAIREAAADHDLVVIFGGSAVTDPADVVPAAICMAGGTVRHIGMPADPGNLLLVGWLGETPVIGAPGCARTARPNGLDLVLPRILAGEHPTPWDITGLGVGGLLRSD